MPIQAALDELRARWFAAMRQADFAAAWQAGDAILAARAPGEQCWHLPRHEQWVWNGHRLEGQRVLVRCYHGLGDTIQFARFLAPLSQIAASTSVWGQPELLPLLQTLACAEHLTLLPLHEGTVDADYDVDLEIMELAHALRATEVDLATSMPYFDVQVAPRLSAHFTVGIALRTGGWDDRRSLPPELARRLLQRTDLELVNLQLNPPLHGMRDASTPDIAHLAERLRALDLVIAPDTMLAHLSGALDVPIWTLLPADADWRWLQPARTNSPWYPRMRLFRQSTPGAWDPVLDEVLVALDRLV